MKSVVITGVSSGIGYGLTKEFLNNGYQVFGSVRKPEDAKRLQDDFGINFHLLVFDVTQQDQIQKEAEHVKKKLNGLVLSGLINNAGFAEGGPLMHIPIHRFKAHLDVLVTGQLMVTQAFLPLLGAYKPKQPNPSRIINISSVSGLTGFPFNGPYVTAKHALEGLSKTLRIELKLYGIKVITIGPGSVKTPIWDKQTSNILEQYKETDYYIALQKIQNLIHNKIKAKALTLEPFCKKIRVIFESKRPGTRYTVVKHKLLHKLLLMMPSQVKDKALANLSGISKD